MEREGVHNLFVQARNQRELGLVLAICLRLLVHLFGEVLLERRWWCRLRVERVLAQSTSLSEERRGGSTGTYIRYDSNKVTAQENAWTYVFQSSGSVATKARRRSTAASPACRKSIADLRRGRRGRRVVCGLGLYDLRWPSASVARQRALSATHLRVACVTRPVHT